MTDFRKFTLSTGSFSVSLRVAVAVGAVLALVPLAPVQAQSMMSPHSTQAGDGSRAAEHADRAEQRGETIEQRITTLHTQLKITPAEETKWQAVAQVMRDNAASMEKLASDKASQSQTEMTAVDDLQTYEQFAQAHVDGLKKLVASFQTLYDAMPQSQKKLADQVFDKSQRQQNG